MNDKRMRKRRAALALLVLCLLSGCAQPAKTPEEQGLTLEQARAYTFSDGASADRWQDVFGNDRYLLSDGTELLWVKKPMGPENVANGRENVQDLSETARAAILAWFEDRGLLYDTEQELERAYERYLTCQKSGERYQGGLVEQTVLPASSNRRIICFETTVTLPLEEPGMAERLSLGTVFDRASGEVISNWDLFAIPEAEVRTWAAEQAAGDDPALREEMAAALEPEWIILEPEELSVWFPRGSLPSHELAYGWFEEYEKAPGAVLQPWAIPDAPDPS